MEACALCVAVQVTVPDGVGAGGSFHIQTPSGQMMQVMMQAGWEPGMQITIAIPAAAPVVVAQAVAIDAKADSLPVGV